MIVEQPVAGAQNRALVREWAPGDSAARGDAKAGGQALVLHTRAVVEGDLLDGRPMILGIGSNFEILTVVS